MGDLMTDADRIRALTLTGGIESFTPGVCVLHQHGFTDDDIASFYEVHLDKVLKARNVTPEPLIPLLSESETEQLISWFSANPLPDC
jgi:hypothetical protein